MNKSEKIQLLEKGKKFCGKCKQIKEISEFGPGHNLGGLRYECNSCRREMTRAYKSTRKQWLLSNTDHLQKYRNDTKERYRKWCADNKDKCQQNRRRYDLKKLYGITLEAYNELSFKQNHRCAICGVEKSNLKNGLYVDHNHATGKARGLLCNNCNVGIGNLQEDVSILQKSIAYLQHHECSHPSL